MATPTTDEHKELVHDLAAWDDGECLDIEPTGTRVAVEEYLSFRVADVDIVDLHWLGDD